MNERKRVQDRERKREKRDGVKLGEETTFDRTLNRIFRQIGRKPPAKDGQAPEVAPEAATSAPSPVPTPAQATPTKEAPAAAPPPTDPRAVCWQPGGQVPDHWGLIDDPVTGKREKPGTTHTPEEYELLKKRKENEDWNTALKREFEAYDREDPDRYKPYADNYEGRLNTWLKKVGKELR
jgi:hypothetical protein